jgi:hypothetical protein
VSTALVHSSRRSGTSRLSAWERSPAVTTGAARSDHRGRRVRRMGRSNLPPVAPRAQLASRRARSDCGDVPRRCAPSQRDSRREAAAGRVLGRKSGIAGATSAVDLDRAQADGEGLIRRSRTGVGNACGRGCRVSGSAVANPYDALDTRPERHRGDDWVQHVPVVLATSHDG